MKNEINKNRFAYFNIGLILSCAFVFWAFQLKVDEKEVVIYSEDEGPEFVAISTIYEVPKPETKKEEPKTKAKVVANSDKFIIKDVIKRSSPLDLSFMNQNQSSDHLVEFAKTDFPAKVVTPDIRPSFPGGQKALMQFLQNNLQYPEDALEDNLSGRVAVLFTVYEDGRIGNIRIMSNNMGPSAEAEARRLMTLMPRWTPGSYKGKKVEAQFVQRIVFQLR